MKTTGFLASILSSVFLFVQCSEYSDIEKDMVLIEGGEFQLGDSSLYAECDEKPKDSVSVGDFFLCKYEVSQELWYAVMKSNPSYHKGKKLPVECVSYEDVMTFLKKLNSLTKKAYRLPTEIEWEYAAKRGLGNNQVWQDIDSIGKYAWHCGNSGKASHILGTKSCDNLGLYDMIGNVNEWCQDQYDGKDYFGAKVDSLKYVNQFVFRGGCFGNDEKFLRITNRNHASADMRNFSLGFRLAMDAK